MKVLITGLGTTKNKGDAAYHSVMIEYLKNKNIDHYLFSCNLKVDKKYFPKTKVIPHSRKKPLKSFMNILTAILGLNNSELKYYKATDLVIDLSGDTLTEEYGIPNLISHSIPLLIAKILKKPYYICSQTIGPFKKSKFFMKYVLKNAISISTRERTSYNHIKSMGLNPKLTFDLGFLLKPKKTKLPTKKKFIAIVPARLKGNKNEKYNKKTIAHLIKAVEYIKNKYKKDIIILADVTDKQHNDAISAWKIANHFSKKDKRIRVVENLDANEMKYVIGKSQLLISMRMHPGIFAFGSLVPVIGLSYGPKFAGVFDLVNMKKYVIELKKLNGVILKKKIDNCIQHKESIVKQIKKSDPRKLCLNNFSFIEKFERLHKHR